MTFHVANGVTITFQSEKDKANITGPKAVGNVRITYEGCENDITNHSDVASRPRAGPLAETGTVAELSCAGSPVGHTALPKE